MLTIPLSVLSLLILGALASYLTGLGLADAWPYSVPEETALLIAQISAAALHLGWALNAALRRSLLAVAVCWPICVWFCHAGLVAVTGEAGDLWMALIVEGVPLVLALSVSKRSLWSHRLARWRRARNEIALQLEMGQGLLPWFCRCLRQLLVGSATTPVGCDVHGSTPSLADVDPRLDVTLSHLAASERLRQLLLMKANDIAAQAEASAAQRSIHLEQRALRAAALCRDECERLHMSAEDRDTLAAQCELMLLEMARR